MEAAKDEKLFRCSWNGDVSTFQDYVRRVRLAFSRTKKKHRKHLAADLVSQLTGRAWTITQEISHERLVKEDGAKYLVQFLESHLARVPVPDAGAKAEELLVKLRRPFGMSMSTWCATVREQYRQLQRALKRAAPLAPVEGKETSPKRSPSVPSTSSPPSPTRSSRKTSKRTVPEPEAPDDEEDDDEELDFEYPDSPDGDDPGEESDARRQWHGRGRKARSTKSDSSDDDDMQWGVRLWDDMDSSLPEVLPPELLGWLMLRRSSLSPQQRLNILASVGNSLKADDIERGLRGAEEELRLHERDPDGRGKGKGGANRPKPRANFWVEQDGEWGLLIEDNEAQEWLEEGTVHWVGHDLSSIYASMDEPPTRAQEVAGRSDGNGFWHQDDDGGYTFWSKAADGEFYTQDQAGIYWAWSDFEEDQVWWSATPEQQKEISEAYATYEGKVRSFAESRALLRHKNLSRGFYPKKGKGKGKPSGFSKGKGAKPTSVPTFVAESPGPSNDVFATSGTPGNAGYTGCFVCGSKAHTFRTCPSRSNTASSSSSKGSGKIYMVSEVEEPYVSEVPEVKPQIEIPQILSSEVLQPELQGYGVLDTGATESVSSLAALEYIHLRRTELMGHGNHVTVIPGPQKMFRFGNGSLQFSESYVHLKQTVGPHEIDLGVFTLDSKGVPLLIGVRTLERLGAIIDVHQSMLVLKTVDPHLVIPLRRSRTGHLLLDLCSNWLDGGARILFMQDTTDADDREKVFAVQELSGYPHAPNYSSTTSPLLSPSMTSLSTTTASLPHELLHDRFHKVEVKGSQVLCVSVDDVHESERCAPSFSLNVETLFPVFEEPSLMQEVVEEPFILEETFGDATPFSSALLAEQRNSDLGMSLRILAILATSTLTSPHGGSYHSEEDFYHPSEGQAAARGDECRRDVRGGHESVRYRSDVWTGQPRSPSPGRSLPGNSRSSATWPRIPDGIQRPCLLGGMCSMPTPAPLCPQLRSPWPDESRRTSSRRHRGEGEGFGELRRLQPGPEEQECGIGCGRELPREAAGSHSSSEGAISSGEARDQAEGKGHSRLCQGRASKGSRDLEPDAWPEESKAGRRGRAPGVPEPDFRGFMEHRWNSSFPGPAIGKVDYKAEKILDLGAMLSKYDLTVENEDMDLCTVLSPNDLVLDNLATAMSNDLSTNEFTPENVNIEYEVPDYLLDPLKYYEAPGEEPEVDEEQYHGTEATYELTPEEVNFIEKTLQEKRMAFEDCLATCLPPSSPEKLDLMELCCEEESLLTKTWRSSGGRAGRMGLHNKCDLLTDSGTQEAIRLVQLHRPEILWVAFPCGATSPLQHLNELTPEGRKRSLRRKARSRRLIKNGVKVIEAQLNQGGEVVQEWPLHNEAWKFDIIKDLWSALSGVGRFEDVLLDGCQFGLKSPQGEFMKKPWRLRSSRPGLLTSMSRRCDGRHSHTPVMGGDLAKRTALYTPAMCRAACRCFLEFLDQPRVFGALEVKIDREGLKTLTEKELSHLAETALKLHRLCGHPSGPALVRTLAAKGADGKLLAVAEQLKCMECLEGTMKKPSPKVSLEKEQKLWRTLQIDAFVLKKGDMVHHFLLMLDEASGFSVVHEVMAHHEEQHENITAQATLDALVQCWFQYFGTPACLRCDLEGAFRGDLLESFCRSRDIELSFVPAEHHEATGDVERAIGELKKKMLAYLRQNTSVEPRLAAYEMCAAHNRFARISGFSPVQWAFGRDLSEEPGLATLSAAGDPTSEMSQNLQRRLDAEAQYRKMQAKAKISRALNAKPDRTTQYIPGDLVYYRRYKFPKDFTAHRELDLPQGSHFRWFGPARVLACETRVSEDPLLRRPGNVVWIVAQGRLKRAHTSQLRHSSERERLIAEATSAPTLPWTFTALGQTLDKGQYEDLIQDKPLPGQRTRRGRSAVRSRSRGPPVLPPPVLQDPHPEPPVPAARSASREASDDSEEELIPVPEESRSHEQASKPPEEPETPMDVQRLLHDPSYMPMKRTSSEDFEAKRDEFLRARHRHEMEDRPLHVKKQSEAASSSSPALWMEDVDQDYVLSVIIPIPEDEAAWKRVLKNPGRFVAKSVQKGAEVAWEKLSPSQKESMKEAKMMEVSQWVGQRVCERFTGLVPRSRLMRTRWVLVFKAIDGDEKHVKCKARIVLLGYTDPDLGDLATGAPTMTRRSRQLLLGLSSLKHWAITKADAKSAFLQGQDTQRARDIYITPVPELAEQLSCKPGECAKMLKAAYGLVSAPREWYGEVNSVITNKLGMKRLTTDGCVWILQDPKTQETLGYVASHVDDFLISGSPSSPLWQKTVETFKEAFSWSPWESSPFTHCGIGVSQEADWSFRLSHHTFVEELRPIVIEDKSDKVTAQEMNQARALLGAMQWRSIQTGPQHSSKVSWLQSALPKGGKDVLHQINKLSREMHHQRYLSVSTRQLGAESVDDIGFVCYTDAAVANRPNFASTGGHLVGMVHRSYLQGQKGFVNPISWRSHKLVRVARSSLSAEVQAMAEGEQELMFVRAEWSELLGRPLDLLRPERSTQHVPAAIITDAKSVYDCVSKGDTTSFNMKEKYTALELMSVFNHLEAQRTALLWVASDSQLADGLTKGSASEMLTRFFQGHQVCAASFDPEFVAAKKKKGKTSTPATSPEPDERAEFDEDFSWRDLVTRSHPASSGTLHEEFLGHVSSCASAFESSLQVPDMPRRFCSGNPSAACQP